MKKHSVSTGILEKAWEESPYVIKEFIEIRPKFEQLCNEVAYILRKDISATNVEYSSITWRAKTLKSFIEKIGRKQYKNPLSEITDLAGVRVVYLYVSERLRIEQVIESEFEIIEKVDKVEEQEFDKFGYGALHYLVTLGEKSSGARYDDLKKLICEIQVRTVGQDAWAIVDHHLSYTQESEVPRILRRKLRALSGLFETADDQFNQLRLERDAYRQTVEKKIPERDKFRRQEVNFDSLLVFVRSTFPLLKPGLDDNHISMILKSIHDFGYRTLGDLERLLSRTEKARMAIRKEHPPPFGISEIVVAMGFVHPDYRRRMRSMEDAFELHEELVEK